MDRIRVAVLMGGPSSEYEVSIASGRMACENLDKNKYEVTPAHITRGGDWDISFETLMDSADVVFLALHGEYGENGTVQQFLDDIGLLYTGSSAKASALGMNKIACSKLFKANGLNIPDWIEITRSDEWTKLRSPFGYPVVVKPMDRGSSVGAGIVRNEFGMQEALCNAFGISRHVMVQRYISGREITCAVLEDERGNVAFPPTEIFPLEAEFFDYNAKYNAGAFKGLTPAPIMSRETEAVQQTAIAVHEIVGASGVSRTDMIIGDDGNIYVLEINTLPDFAPTSLLLQAADSIGLSNSVLLDKIIASAIKKRSPNAPFASTRILV